MTIPHWPACSLAQADAALTAPGAPFEIEEIEIRGVTTRVWTNAPPTLAALVEQSRLHGDRAFVVLGAERLSYAAHYGAVATLARWLVAQGVGKGDRVAVAMRNLPEWPVAFFAATAVGAVVVPLNAWWTGPELALCLADSGTSILIADEERGNRLRPHRHELPALAHVVIARGSQDLGQTDMVALEDILGRPADYAGLPDTAMPVVPTAADDDATIFYTSGTTGRPKGVLGTHRSLTSCVLSSSYAAARAVLRRGDPMLPAAPKTRLIATPLFHLTGCGAGLIAGMRTGNTNVLMPRWDAGAALAIVEKERVQIVVGVPTVAWQLLEHPDRKEYDLTSLEGIAYGGAPSAPELVRRIATDLGATPGNGWGMTETGGTVCSLSAEDYRARPESCGPAVPVAELKILAPDDQQEMPAGAVGELWVKGPMVARGYWRRPDESAAVFVDGWVRTGDLARLDEDGFCTIVDRAKDIVIRGGENIYSNEVEHILYAHPAVVDAALIGLPHRTLGEEPAAVVQLAPGALITEAELRNWVRERLAAFKVPVAIRFVPEPLPRNAVGKVLKGELRSLFSPASAAPDERVK